MRIFFFLVLTNIHLLVFSQKPVEKEQVIPPDGIQQLTWEKEKADTVFELIDPLKSPVFPGGEKDLLKFIAENSRWPKECGDMNLAGMIVVQFVIDTFGQAVDLKILKTPGKCFEPLIAEIFAKMPCWKPGEWFGSLVRVRYVLPIRLHWE